mmetsp:Transcript_144778/g.463998  ORF Transcript_144778/g.463998 Transcript_144778/m.463998 type:complete len:200 (-) Transcript_144778:1011-1610(-)
MALTHPQMGGSGLCGFHVSLSARKSHVCLRIAKTTAVSPGCNDFVSTDLNLSILARSDVTITVCVTFGLALSSPPPAPCPIRTCTALLLVNAAAALCTTLGQVAVKKSVCLALPKSTSLAKPDLGHLSTILRMSASKPMSSILSASSRIKYLTAPSATVGGKSRDGSPFMKSRRRPVVAMRTSAPPLSSATCSPFPTPP